MSSVKRVRAIMLRFKFSNGDLSSLSIGLQVLHGGNDISSDFVESENTLWNVIFRQCYYFFVN
jgi:hypothetical protein